MAVRSSWSSRTLWPFLFGGFAAIAAPFVVLSVGAILSSDEHADIAVMIGVAAAAIQALTWTVLWRAMPDGSPGQNARWFAVGSWATLALGVIGFAAFEHPVGGIVFYLLASAALLVLIRVMPHRN